MIWAGNNDSYAYSDGVSCRRILIHIESQNCTNAAIADADERSQLLFTERQKYLDSSVIHPATYSVSTVPTAHPC